MPWASEGGSELAVHPRDLETGVRLRRKAVKRYRQEARRRAANQALRSFRRSSSVVPPQTPDS